MLTSSSASLRHPILHPSASLRPKAPTLHLTPSSSLKFQPNPKPQSHLLSNSHHYLVGVPLLGPRRRPDVVAMSKSPKVEEQKFSQEGLVTESLPNGMFRIKLDNADTIIGYICGKIRKSFIRILPGDRVLVEVSRYDTARGRIVYRLKKEKENNVRGAKEGKKNKKNKLSNMSLQPINTNRGANGSGQTTPKGSRLPPPEQAQCPSAPKKPQPRSKYINYQ